jgi:hypothetical protein
VITPCRSCPFRRSVTPADIPGGGVDRYRASLAAGEGSLGFVMACHLSSDEDPLPCAGWVVVVGRPVAHSNGEGAIPMRIALMRGEVDVHDYDAGGADLFDSMEEMLDAQEVP